MRHPLRLFQHAFISGNNRQYMFVQFLLTVFASALSSEHSTIILQTVSGLHLNIGILVGSTPVTVHYLTADKILHATGKRLLVHQ